MGAKVDVPTVSFRIIPIDEEAEWERRQQKQANLNRTQLEAYGYNPKKGKPWTRPKHYMRYIEPIETELANQVEYDMDEQDREWVDLVNAERQGQQLDRLSYELFEVIMDKLEKEWFDLVKKIPAPAALPIEDSKCSICDDGEGENSNAIVFCDGCNLAVHQDCYGVPYIPEGQWLCRKCTVEPENPVDCIFCPAEAGAFKQTTNAKWAHLLCAMWVPEVSVSNPVYMEPIEGAETIPKSRWKLNCSICRIKGGACIQCDNKNCFTAFHVTCARGRGNLGSMKALLQDGVLRAYCDRHMPAEQMVVVQAARAERAEKEEQANGAHSGHDDTLSHPGQSFEASKVPELAKTARAHAKKYTQGPPLVPALIVDSILSYVQKARLRKMKECVEKICRYWSLKREARRGAPLLKRLYLEPWTASSATREQTDAEKVKKLQYLITVRNDLEEVRRLVKFSHEREEQKLLQAQALQEFIDEVLFPHDGKLRFAFEKIGSLDRQQYFAHPVSTQDVPDYLDIIKQPMSWDEIDERLETHAYNDLAEFQRDVYLVLDNAMLYNPSDHPFHRLASKIKKTAIGIFAELAAQFSSGIAQQQGESQDVSTSLEPSTQALEPLLERDQGDHQDRLAQLFAYELFPLPPPSPLPKIKIPRPPPQKRDPAARRELLQVATSSRATRSSGSAAIDTPIDEAFLPKELRTTIPKWKTKRPAVVKPLSSKSDAHAPSGVNTAPASEAADDSTIVIPLKTRERGVLGKVVYSPMTDQERRAKEKQMSLVVDEVDLKETFSRFNVGYVLPEGSKRRGRAAPLPPPPVAGPSRLPQQTPKALKRRSQPHPPTASSSDISDAPEEDATIVVLGRFTDSSPRRASSQPDKGSDTEDRPKEDEEDVRKISPSRSSPLSDLITVESPLSSVSSAPPASPPRGTNRPTPRVRASRRDTARATTPTVEIPKEAIPERRSRRSTKRPRLPDSPVQPAPTELAKMSPKPVDRQKEDSGPAAPATRTRNGRNGKSAADDDPPVSQSKAATPPPEPQGEAVPALATNEYAIDEDQVSSEPSVKERLQAFRGTNNAGKAPKGWQDPYPAGNLVWAKSGSFPFFPGEVFDVPGEYYRIPEAVWATRPEHSDESTWLVRFYDGARSFAWCRADCLAGLGDDDATDQMFLSGRNPTGRLASKWSSHSKGVRAAYRRAQADMALSGEEFD